ncbi:MAG: GPW/gp25 family protein [Synergistaceae bacterium]|nr:GPW/gp25 family protein [Synergistaceae bacterium]MBR0205021.1 GPW/gp25 family protein [Synergistaceae bacterium]
MNPKEITFAPENTVEEVVQNVRTICTTPKYSVPMDRAFGVDAKMLDRPTPKAMAALQAELIQAIRKFEPRCKVKKIYFDGDIDGRLNFIVRILIDNEV